MLMEHTKSVKISEAELAELNRIRELYTDAQYAFGQLYISKKQLDEQERIMSEAYKKLQSDEQTFLNQVIEKYGEGNLDPKTGILTLKN